MEFVNSFTRLVIKMLVIVLSLILIFSLVEFIFILGRAIFTHHAAFDFSAATIDRSKLFLSQVQGFISAILLLTIVIELISSLMEYLKVGSANYVVIIIEIALIAIVRHILAIDLEHLEPNMLLGVSALIFVLSLTYLVLTKKLRLPGTKE